MPSKEAGREPAQYEQGAAALPAQQARVEEGLVVHQAPLALLPPPRVGLLQTVRSYVPGAALFAGGLLIGFILGPTAPKE